MARWLRLHLEKECVLDVDWAYDEADWKHPNDHNGTVNLIKIVVTSATLVVTSALLVVTRS